VKKGKKGTRCKRCGSYNLSMRITETRVTHYPLDYITKEFDRKSSKEENKIEVSYKCWSCGSTNGVK
jgi:hypothetical protein